MKLKIPLRFWLVVTNLLMSGVALDILYLYYSGAWNDQSKLIEITEVVVMWLFVASGVVAAIINCIKMFMEGRRK